MTADVRAGGTEPEDTELRREHARLGEYRLVQRLGEGGMGVVHLGLDRHGRAVAVKVLRHHVAHDPEARARLQREVETLGRIRSPRVAPIIDADVDGHTPYIVTRYVPGPPLDDLVAERGPLRPAELHRVASGVAQALDSIHSAGVVHRDVKPGNVLLVDGDPVLIDFGIAHVADDIRLTLTGLVMGTPGYLAPEVVGGEDVTPATDWWGWAATTAFAASGTPPFGRGGMSAVLARVASGEPDLRAVDPRIEPLLYAALSPDPADRPHHHEVVAALERYAVGAPVTEAIRVRTPPPTEVLETSPTSALPTAPTARPPVAPAVAAGAVGGTAGAAGPVSAPPAPAPVPHAEPPQAPGQPGAPVPQGEPGREVARPGQGPYGDPRIGRPNRSGTLLALLALFTALTARAPLLALLALVAWVTLARTADRSVTSLVLRRHARGARGSDVAVAVASSPWHLVVGAVGAAATVLLPFVVGICAMFATALVITAVTGADAAADGVVPLASAALFAALTAWWGPGGASLRRGSRSLVRGLTPGARATQVLAAGLVVGAAALGVASVAADSPSWWPRTTAPGWVDDVIPRF